MLCTASSAEGACRERFGMFVLCPYSTTTRRGDEGCPAQGLFVQVGDSLRAIVL